MRQTHRGREKPEEHVAVSLQVDGEVPCVALNVLVSRKSVQWVGDSSKVFPLFNVASFYERRQVVRLSWVSEIERPFCIR